MARKLVLAALFTLLAFSGAVQALGLGDIKLKSALNQIFNAEIELLSVETGELDGLRVKLASPEAFERAGVDRPFLLTQLKFEVKQVGPQRATIRVTSENAIPEPYLNFLVEVNWPQGRLIREYTVLLDPPTTTDRRAPVVAAPVAAAPSAESARAPVAPASATRSAPVAGGGPGEYGPVKANETLWQIARRVKPGDVSIWQAMIGLHRANPSAFYGNNINRLKRGQILRVPEAESLRRLSNAEARRDYQAQVDAWRAQRSARTAKASAGAAGKARAAAGGGDGAPVSAPSEDRVKLTSPRPADDGQAGPAESPEAARTAERLQSDLLLARENAESYRQEAESLRSQVDELDGRLGDMDKLLKLKDQQLAKLQSMVESGPGAMQPGPDAAAPAPAAADASAADAAQPVDRSDILASSQIDKIGKAEPTPAPEAKPPQSQPQPEPAAPPAPEPAPVVADAGDTTPTQDDTPSGGEAGFVKMLTDNMMLIGIVVAVLLVLLILVLVMKSRKRAADTAGGAEESILLEGDDSLNLDDVGEADEMPESELKPGTSTGDTSFLSEFSPSDLKSLPDDTGEVDPQSEADVYIAYGRYDQAQDLLRQALDKDPGRTSLRFKLLDVYFASRNADAFSALVEEMREAGDDAADPEAWQRVLDMGREMDPDSSLFVPADGDVPMAGPSDSDIAQADTEPLGAKAEDGDLHAEEPDFDVADLDLSDLASELTMDDAAKESELKPSTNVSQAAMSDNDALPQGFADELESLHLDVDPQSESVPVTDPRADSSMVSKPVTEPVTEHLEPDSQQITDTETLDLSEFKLDAPDEPVEASHLNTDPGPVEFDPDAAEDDPHHLGDDSLMEMDNIDEADLEKELKEISDLSALDSEFAQLEEDSAVIEQPLAPEDFADKKADTADEDEVAAAIADVDEDVPSLLEPSTSSVDAESASLEPLSMLTDAEEDVETKLELAEAYIEMGDQEGARDILVEVQNEGNESQKVRAERMMADLEATA